LRADILMRKIVTNCRGCVEPCRWFATDCLILPNDEVNAN